MVGDGAESPSRDRNYPLEYTSVFLATIVRSRQSTGNAGDNDIKIIALDGVETAEQFYGRRQSVA